jgi:hypothetical protein
LGAADFYSAIISRRSTSSIWLAAAPTSLLPPGIYNVAFGPTLWRSVEIKASETTVLEPGTIEVQNPLGSGHKVLDWETGTEVGDVSSFVSRLSVISFELHGDVRQRPLGAHRDQGR